MTTLTLTRQPAARTRDGSDARLRRTARAAALPALFAGLALAVAGYLAVAVAALLLLRSAVG